ncbi:sirohydrochlorin chelatase [Radiobacillus kanasensis]|uniref:sirohydrochlorin chelatase n=1 Tax=Radiobacillus kanasensis TaxID=2844358 RepID=UPI001E2A0B62|nr:sirohydrochlorin chelatase [Radiobacillus kanasensis]UFU00672.1 sirohydrochlorin chelatase [Radiobacillus kanasensis]
MQAVLYVCHGSRRREAVDEAVDFVEKTMVNINVPIQEYCFLELANPWIPEGIERCIQRGATRIAIIPVLLLTATHAKKDIPKMVQETMKSYPEVKVSYGETLGVQQQLVDVLVKRIKEQNPPTTDMEILLVGRGSSDPNTLEDIQLISDMLSESMSVKSVEKCFLAAAEPKFGSFLARKVTFGSTNIVVVPYLLFTGMLMREINQTVRQLELHPEQKVTVCEYLGRHPNVCVALQNRVLEAIGEGDKRAEMA